MPMDRRIFSGVIVCIVTVLSPIPLRSQSGSADGQVVARFQGGTITQDELSKFSSDDLEKLELERQQFEANWQRSRHQVFEASLARLLEDKLLQAEAAKRGMTKDQLLEKELQGKVKDPTEEDVKAYYEANKQRINQPLLQISSQIFQYLKSENYNRSKAVLVDQLKGAYGVTATLEPLRSKVETEGSPSEGQATAPVTLVEFSDFQCPYCANLFGTLRQVMQRYGTQVRLVFRNFPLSQIHPYAEKAAEAGLCAADQGQFWSMHDLMFQTQAQLKEEDLKAKAAQLKLNTEIFDACLTSGKNAGKVKQDLYAGSKLGIAGTPALFINGRFVSGAVPLNEIARIIDEELKSSTQQDKQAATAIK
jgi:protein-disulfide isomerase